MKHKLLFVVASFCALGMFSSCNDFNSVMKYNDYQYKYEAAKQYYTQGYYNRASLLLADVIAVFKGTDRGEESLYLLGMSSYKAKDYDAAHTYFQKYYESYPKGLFAEEALYYSGMALYKMTPEPKLDQSDTYQAITQFTQFIDAFPDSRLRKDAQDRIFELQDKLVEKQYIAAKLYYDLGDYIGNGLNGNYKACIVTAENAINDYPYSKKREAFSWLILKAKYEYAKNSIPEKQAERYQDAIDEYYGFINEFPQSVHLKEAKALYQKIPLAFRKTDASS